MIFKKGSEAVTNRTIAIILGLLLLILVFGIIFKLDPNFLYKLLPNYNVETDTGDEVIEGVDDSFASPCEGLGMKTVGKLEQGGCISLIENQQQAFTSRKCTDLVYDKNKDYDATIKSDVANDWKWSLDIASAKKRVEGEKEIYDVSVDPYYLDENKEIYVKKLFAEVDFKFSAEQLAILNGAQYRANFICKKLDNSGSLLTGYVPSWPKETNVGIIDLSSTAAERVTKGYWFSETFKTGERFYLNLFPVILNYEGEKYYLERSEKEDYLKIYREIPGVEANCFIGLIEKEGYLYFGTGFIKDNLFKLSNCPNFETAVFNHKALINSEEFSNQFPNSQIEYLEIVYGSFYKTNIKVDYQKIIERLI